DLLVGLGRACVTEQDKWAAASNKEYLCMDEEYATQVAVNTIILFSSTKEKLIFSITFYRRCCLSKIQIQNVFFLSNQAMGFPNLIYHLESSILLLMVFCFCA
ncbi:hypothetical protein ACJX0J_026470, partial [Zea mays]